MEDCVEIFGHSPVGDTDYGRLWIWSRDRQELRSDKTQTASRGKGAWAWDTELSLPRKPHPNNIVHGTQVTRGRQCIRLNWAFVNFPLV